MSNTRHPNASSRLVVIAAFAIIYLIWGSTYLAIRFAVETLPPFLMAGVRFTIAGTILYVWMRLRGTPRPTGVNWRGATIAGSLIMLCANGIISWAEQWVPSGLVALLASTTPLWMVLLDWLRVGGIRPGGKVILGLLLGLIGIGLLAGPGKFGGGSQLDLLGTGVIMLAAISWSAGSLYSRHASLPESSLLSAGMQMLTGGILLVIAGTILGEWGGFDLETVSLRSVLAMIYLIVFGALVGFSAYLWLLRVSTPARVSTHAYVNPVVAVFLGWALGDEQLAPRTLLAAAVIVMAVVLITAHRAREARMRESRA